MLELGDGASTDSGWGGSASSSAEEKSSGRERDGDNDDDDGDDERSTSSSGGGGSSAGRRGAPSAVSGSELAVFLFQGGVQSESDSALEAKDGSSEPSAVARGSAAQRSLHLLPPSEDAFFEYSGSGGERSSETASGGLRTGGLGSSSTVGKAATRERGDPAAMSGEDAAAMGGVDFSERREAGVDRGTKSASLTGELRGVDFVNVPARTSPRPKGGDV